MGNKHISVSSREVRRTLVLHPAAAAIREDVYCTYACQRCKAEAIETPILKTEKAPPVISGSFASPETIAHIMVQKFVMASPLYRQERKRQMAEKNLFYFIVLLTGCGSQSAFNGLFYMFS